MLVGLLGAQAVLLTQLLHTAPDFDEGVYLLAVDALRHGQSLGNDVFVAQPPGFYALLRGDAAIFGFGVTSMRVGIVLLAAAGAAGAWLLCRSRAGVMAGLLAVALLTIAPPIPLFGARILADLPALWLALLGVGLAAAVPGRRHATVIAAVSGAVCAFALLVKLDAVVCLPVAALLIAVARERRRLLAAAAIAAGAVLLASLLIHVTALPELWESVIQYHRDARATADVIDRWKEIRGLFNLRTPFVWLAAAGLALFVVRIGRRVVDRAEVAMWSWAGVALVFLAVHQPLHYNHLVALPVPLALATALSIGGAWNRARPRAQLLSAVILVIVLGGGYVQQMRRVQLDDVPERSCSRRRGCGGGGRDRPRGLCRNRRADGRGNGASAIPRTARRHRAPSLRDGLAHPDVGARDNRPLVRSGGRCRPRLPHRAGCARRAPRPIRTHQDNRRSVRLRRSPPRLVLAAVSVPVTQV